MSVFLFLTSLSMIISRSIHVGTNGIVYSFKKIYYCLCQISKEAMHVLILSLISYFI